MKSILNFLGLILIIIVVSLAPELLGGDLEELLKKQLGERYHWIIIVTSLCALLIYTLLTDAKGWFQKKDRQKIIDEIGQQLTFKKLSSSKIIWTKEHTEIVQNAKKLIRYAKPAKAIQVLHQLKIVAINDELILLSSRLKTIQKQDNMGIVTYKQNTTTFNQINKAILNVIVTIEEILQEENEIYQKIKTYLSAKYQNRLGQKLAGRQPINIKKNPSVQGTSKETSQIFETINIQNIQGELREIFQTTYGRLLITGAPGTGKTTLLLQLVSKLLETETSAIPIVLNLATWQSHFTTLDNWLNEILPSEMGVNKALAKKIVKEFRLILLLDGLDEVRKDDRKSCLEAIGRYGKDADKQYVISSRIKEYKNVMKDAPVNYQIEVAPLTVAQVKQELKRLGHEQPEAMRLLQAIEKDTLLREIVQNSFYFNTLQLIFANGVSWSDLDFQADTIKGRQQEIVERLVKIELKYQEAYAAEKVQKWLGFLADGMNRHNLVVFELIDLQYTWSKWNFIQMIIPLALHSLLNSIVKHFGMLCFSIIIIFCGNENLSFFDNLMFLSNMLLFIVFMEFFVVGCRCFLYETGYFSINSRQAFFLSKSSLLEFFKFLKKRPLFSKDELIWAVKFYFVVSPIFCFFTLVYKYLIHLNIEGLIFQLITETLILQLIYLLIMAVILSIKVFLFCLCLILPLTELFFIATSWSIWTMFSEDYDNTITKRQQNKMFKQFGKPYQKFITYSNPLNLAILQHGLLRIQLYKKEHLPFRLVVFLNAMTKQHLLESDGAKWRFRHRILQDYFANLWQDKQENPNL